jgi:hypothetical protein
LNADGPQELFVFVLNRSGRVETSNYRTVKLPTDLEIPLFVEDRFGDFYRDLFTRAVEKERMRTVFLEYAWDMGWCDPCAADPLSDRELRELGVSWIESRDDVDRAPGVVPRRPVPRPGTQARDVFITRLHLRYTDETFPEDLFFRETGDRTNFQGRYILRHPWQGSPDACPQARAYFEELERRQDREAETLASVTGWDLGKIRLQMGMGDSEKKPEDDEPWWKKLWGG